MEYNSLETNSIMFPELHLETKTTEKRSAKLNILELDNLILRKKRDTGSLSFGISASTIKCTTGGLWSPLPVCGGNNFF